MHRIAIVLCIFAITLTLMSNHAQDEIDLTLPDPANFDIASIEDINIEDVPVVPELTDHAREIYARGIENGNNPKVFSKVGDCMTASYWYFLGPFADGEYDLGDYSDLQPVIDYFDAPARAEGFEQNAFNNPGLATTSGFNSASVLDSIWADPNWCNANESPLACEYRLSRPSFSLIMFGTNDSMFFEPDFFDFYMRSIVVQTIEADIVPILYTIPWRPEFPEKIEQFNKIVIKIAQDYDVPVVNLNLAIADLPYFGVDEAEPIHLSIPPDEISTGILSDENLQYGYVVRNLITLQTFDIMLNGLEVDL